MKKRKLKWKHEHDFSILVGDVYIAVSFDTNRTHVYIDCGDGEKLSDTFRKCGKASRKRFLLAVERVLLDEARTRKLID